MSARRVRVRKGARHIPRRHQGEVAEVVERKRLSFGRRWLRIRFEDGASTWVREGRVEAV